MDASIIIGTRNRAESLARTLDSLSRIERPKNFSFEILIVNNGSTDRTSEVVGAFSGQIPVREILEPAAGLSNARNCGAAAAKGEYIIWTDDDVLVDSDWLVAYAAAFEFREAVFFGGKIIPVLEGETPRWFRNGIGELLDLVASCDFGHKPLALTRNRLPYGANFSIKADVQRRYRYDPALGVAPGRFRTGEETSVMRDILEAGYTGLYVPQSRVQHMIPHSRQSLRYVVQYYRAQGETAVLGAAEVANRLSRRWIYARLAVAIIKGFVSASAFGCLWCVGGEVHAIRWLKTFARAIGTLDGIRFCQRRQSVRLIS